jgi:hypothetical protein
MVLPAGLQVLYPTTTAEGFLVREATSPAPNQPRLLDRVRATIRARHYSRRTEKAYVAWIRRFILFHHKRHPTEMGGAEVTQFLSALATEDDEWLTRLNVLQLHDCTSRLKMFTELTPSDVDLPAFQAQADELRGRIAARTYFGALPQRRRQHLLKGDNAFLLSHDELLRRMNEDVGEFRGMYRFLSFHVHNLPVAFYRMGEREQGRGVESDWEKNNIAMVLEFAARPIKRATREMRDLFPDLQIIEPPSPVDANT